MLQFIIKIVICKTAFIFYIIAHHNKIIFMRLKFKPYSVKRFIKIDQTEIAHSKIYFTDKRVSRQIILQSKIDYKGRIYMNTLKKAIITLAIITATLGFCIVSFAEENNSTETIITDDTGNNHTEDTSTDENDRDHTDIEDSNTENTSEEAADTDETVTITFYYYSDEQDGEQRKVVTIKKGECVPLWIPEQTGWIFLKWEYKDGETVNEDDVFFEDCSIFALYDYIRLPEPVEKGGPTCNLNEVLEQSEKDSAISRTRISISSLKNKKSRKATFKVFLNNTVEGSEIEIQYSTNKKFKKAKTKTIRVSSKTTKVTLKKLKKGKTYYVRARVKLAFNEKYICYSSWSDYEKIEIKK